MRNKNFNSKTTIEDILWNINLVLKVLFILALAQIAMMSKSVIDHNIKSDAQYLVTITWPDENPDDVDLWIEHDGKDIVWFSHKSAGLMNLERDDRGLIDDTVIIDGQTIEVKQNKETVTLRGIIPGEYIVNIHMYTKRSKNETPVKVLVEKLNPYSIKSAKTVKLTHGGEEVTALRFNLDEKGEINRISDEPKRFVGTSHIEPETFEEP